MIDQYKVEADRATGQWHGPEQYEGEIDQAEWAKKVDTDNCHYDTYQKQDQDGNWQTCAIEVTWVD